MPITRREGIGSSILRVSGCYWSLCVCGLAVTNGWPCQTADGVCGSRGKWETKAEERDRRGDKQIGNYCRSAICNYSLAPPPAPPVLSMPKTTVSSPPPPTLSVVCGNFRIPLLSSLFLAGFDSSHLISPGRGHRSITRWGRRGLWVQQPLLGCF